MSNDVFDVVGRVFLWNKYTYIFLKDDNGYIYAYNVDSNNISWYIGDLSGMQKTAIVIDFKNFVNQEKYKLAFDFICKEAFVEKKD